MSEELKEKEIRFRCNLADSCGYDCFHGKPHKSIRCPSCFTWCGTSLLCQDFIACGRDNDRVPKNCEVISCTYYPDDCPDDICKRKGLCELAKLREEPKS